MLSLLSFLGEREPERLGELDLERRGGVLERERRFTGEPLLERERRGGGLLDRLGLGDLERLRRGEREYRRRGDRDLERE